MGLRIVILGGSSPFTVAFINCLAAIDFGIEIEIRFQGRNSRNLDLILNYAKRKLPNSRWRLESKTDLSVAIEDTDIVINQIRFGGWEGRHHDERLAVEFGLPPDETLGPSGLSSGIRSASDFRRLADTIVKTAGNPWVLNLSNPMSFAVYWFNKVGLTLSIGLCELPFVTLKQIASILKLPAESISWQYNGLNHRGFLYGLMSEGKALMSDFLAKLGEQDFNGIPPSIIRQLNCIPLHYFRKFLSTPEKSYHRSYEVESLRNAIATELESDINESPPSIAKRYMDWYPYALVPVLRAIIQDEESVHVVNTLSDTDQYVSEQKAVLHRTGFRRLPIVPAPAPTDAWIQRLIRHELKALQAIENPEFETIYAALLSDPLVPTAVAKGLAKHMAETLPTHL